MSTSDDSNSDRSGANTNPSGAQKASSQADPRHELATRGAGGKSKRRSRIESSSSSGTSTSEPDGGRGPLKKRTKRIETGESRVGTRAEESNEEIAKSTKSCPQTASSSSSSLPESKKRKRRERQTNADGEEMIPLGANRFITVREFKGKTLVDIRQYYVDNKSGSGQLKPTPKGISLSPEQYEEMKKVLGAVDEKLEEV